MSIAKSGSVSWAHLGIPDVSWSPMRALSIGTRHKGRPLGDGTREEERIANGEVVFALVFMKAVLAAGGFVTFVNPSSSLVWWHPKILSFVRRTPALSIVDLDQCQFGLGSPPGLSSQEFWKKGTRVLTNFPSLEPLGKTCAGLHIHTPLRGTIKIYGKHVSRAKLASAYPPQLSGELARLAAAHFHGADL